MKKIEKDWNKIVIETYTELDDLHFKLEEFLQDKERSLKILRREATERLKKASELISEAKTILWDGK